MDDTSFSVLGLPPPVVIEEFPPTPEKVEVPCDEFTTPKHQIIPSLFFRRADPSPAADQPRPQERAVPARGGRGLLGRWTDPGPRWERDAPRLESIKRPAPTPTESSAAEYVESEHPELTPLVTGEVLLSRKSSRSRKTSPSSKRRTSATSKGKASSSGPVTSGTTSGNPQSPHGWISGIETPDYLAASETGSSPTATAFLTTAKRRRIRQRSSESDVGVSLPSAYGGSTRGAATQSRGAPSRYMSSPTATAWTEGPGAATMSMGAPSRYMSSPTATAWTEGPGSTRGAPTMSKGAPSRYMSSPTATAWTEGQAVSSATAFRTEGYDEGETFHNASTPLPQSTAAQSVMAPSKSSRYPSARPSARSRTATPHTSSGPTSERPHDPERELLWMEFTPARPEDVHVETPRFSGKVLGFRSKEDEEIWETEAARWVTSFNQYIRDIDAVEL